MVGCKNQDMRGFTLIEVLVTLVIAMVVMGGLLLNFTNQNKEYKYQNARIDVVQDMEFALKFIAEDLRSSLIDKDLANPIITITNATADPYAATTQLSFVVWDAGAPGVGADARATRRYDYNGSSLSYARNNGVAKGLVSNVAYFKVLKDSETTGENTRHASYPLGLPNITLNRPDTGTISVPGYTIVIQAEVGDGTRKRVTKIVQVHPMTVVD